MRARGACRQGTERSCEVVWWFGCHLRSSKGTVRTSSIVAACACVCASSGDVRQVDNNFLFCVLCACKLRARRDRDTKSFCELDLCEYGAGGRGRGETSFCF